MANPKNNEKQAETRTFLSDDRGVSHELKIERHGDDFAVLVDPNEDGWDESIISETEDADRETRSHLFALYESTCCADPLTARLVISPREDGGWDLAYRAESKAREPARVLFEEGSDEHLQIVRLWNVLGGETDESLNKDALADQEVDDGYVHESRALSVLVHGSKNKKVDAGDLVEALREIEKMIERMPGDPGMTVRLVRRLSEVLSSMTAGSAGR